MIDIKLIRDKPELVKEGIRKKQSSVDTDLILQKDRARKSLLLELEDLRAEQGRASREIAALEGEVKTLRIWEMKELADKIKTKEPELKKIDEEINSLIMQIPNLPLKEVPEGKDESENVVIKKWGEPNRYAFQVKDHLMLGKELDLIDVESASRVSGSRFYYLKREAVFLEFALINYALEILSQEGFIPIVPPVLAREDVLVSMGYLPQLDQEMYKTALDDMRLIATSEHTLGPLHMEEILESDTLPLRYAGFSTCFRREAGSYGKDIKGIFRVHQFDKVEMFTFCHQEDSPKEHDLMLNLEEQIVQGLGLPYQVVLICSGDLGFPAAKKYDIECWLPGQERYRETHSTSNCTDFQSRRLNIRHRVGKNKVEFVHTLNGTAVAIGRMLIAIMENYQQADGSIVVPEVLRKYTGFDRIYR
ncbi:MAG: Serine--tRNA ligase [candidate division WS2 bacterium]|uniref:Serine--tRNA ligase n=1 Tax=Psychracetigena formicireducens TaxID=2986056 RepID=A0A9E2BH83_PSYF1|nr:Serine--tRNA ligase [Candidatus Psychracetigena formicireducens]MBT9145009.1 Serine--tRNA ligase [Candidatus Psychracetigena formicireducens]MBT9150251.1 Serine--tRNA ligase [Candidatus Psychracetigena formicireducens]